MRTKLIVVSLLLASCSDMSMPKLALLTPHKIEIRQGNMVTPEMREKLKTGMSRLQVRSVLGTPLINDPFHASRWDYVYRLEQKGKLVEQQRLTLYFEGDNLVKIDDGKTVETAPVVAPQVVVPAASEPVTAAPVIVAPPRLPQPVVKADPAKADPVADVLSSVQGWAAAWSARDVAKYLASYAATFKPNGVSKATWEVQRKERISKTSSIAVEVSDLNIKLHDDNHASATFRQSYRSDSHQDSTRKMLQLEKVGDAWLIVSEQAAK